MTLYAAQLFDDVFFVIFQRVMFISRTSSITHVTSRRDEDVVHRSGRIKVLPCLGDDCVVDTAQRTKAIVEPCHT